MRWRFSSSYSVCTPFLFFFWMRRLFLLFFLFCFFFSLRSQKRLNFSINPRLISIFQELTIIRSRKPQGPHRLTHRGQSESVLSHSTTPKAGPASSSLKNQSQSYNMSSLGGQGEDYFCFVLGRVGLHFGSKKAGAIAIVFENLSIIQSFFFWNEVKVYQQLSACPPPLRYIARQSSASEFGSSTMNKPGMFNEEFSGTFQPPSLYGIICNRIPQLQFTDLMVDYMLLFFSFCLSNFVFFNF